MIFLLICFAVGYPIELLEVTDKHVVLLINVDDPFTLALISNSNIDSKNKWKPQVTYRQTKLSNHQSPIYVELPKKMSNTKYYAYRLQTGKDYFFTKAFFFDEGENKYLTTSEEDEKQRRIGDSKNKEEDSEEPKDRKLDDVMINIGVLLFIIVLVLVIIGFSACAL